MHVDFTTIHNLHEKAVFERVLAEAGRHPGLSGSAELLADVACVALNRLAPRYIRHDLDHAFYLAEGEARSRETELAEAVEFAFGFVQARQAMGART